ncbi:hypothetical protein [Carboxylicivirga sp. N1Y90]|uniref:hypothetical protein n=1 Tax=Carboxylicivirga fragile TaxID=3417571 RepID=UPI003D32CF40|nr:hypothetical protein [Marinilabiliaceae bacterium N1Y90]
MRLFILFSLLIIPIFTNAQIGVDYHQSSIPFFGINYEINERFRPEFRIGTDVYFEEISIEGIVTYDIITNTDYEFYTGFGGRTGDFEGFVFPVGLNFYPLAKKQFGFHVELTPIFGESNILRGSLGIRYKFGK